MMLLVFIYLCPRPLYFSFCIKLWYNEQELPMVIRGSQWVPMGYLPSGWCVTHGVVDLYGAGKDYCHPWLKASSLIGQQRYFVWGSLGRVAV